MIKEHKNDDLIYYIPLSSNGDLSDRVSGNVIELSGNGSMVWDATEGMYLITNPSTTGQYVGRIAINDYPYRFPLDSFTSIGQLKRKSTSGSRGTPFYNITGGAIAIYYNGSQNLANYPNTVVKSCVVIDNQNANRKFYQQGTLYRTYAAASTWLPSSWGADGYIYFGVAFDSSALNTQYWVKEFYLFNRVLAAAEIYKIQGY